MEGRDADTCLPLQKNGQKERGEQEELAFKGGLAHEHRDNPATSCMHTDYVVVKRP